MSVASGVIKDIGSIDNLVKLVNIPGVITPGAIICYDEGQNYGYTNTDGTTGIYYPSPGHLQTIEVVYNDESLFNKTKQKAAVRTILSIVTTMYLAITYSNIFRDWLLNISSVPI